MATAADCIWDLQQTAPPVVAALAQGPVLVGPPGPPTAAAATAAGTPGAGHPPTATPVGCRPRRPLPGK
jgi:hypothetical protein